MILLRLNWCYVLFKINYLSLIKLKVYYFEPIQNSLKINDVTHHILLTNCKHYLCVYKYYKILLSLYLRVYLKSLTVISNL